MVLGLGELALCTLWCAALIVSEMRGHGWPGAAGVSLGTQVALTQGAHPAGRGRAMLHSHGSWALTVGDREPRQREQQEGRQRAGRWGWRLEPPGLRWGCFTLRSAQRKPAIQVRPLALQRRAPGLLPAFDLE